MAAQSTATLIGRVIGRRCPLCGGGEILKSHFRMNRECSRCHSIFWKDPGESLGAMYVDYAVATVAFLACWPILAFGTSMSDTAEMFVLGAIAALSVIVFYPWSRSAWTMLVYLSGGMERPALKSIEGGKGAG